MLQLYGRVKSKEIQTFQDQEPRDPDGPSVFALAGRGAEFEKSHTFPHLLLPEPHLPDRVYRVHSPGSGFWTLGYAASHKVKTGQAQSLRTGKAWTRSLLGPAHHAGARRGELSSEHPDDEARQSLSI